MPRVRIEFTVEPFVDGHPGDHVVAAWSAVEGHGCELVTGPFSAETEVPERAAADIVADVVRAALSHGADRVSFQVERLDS